MAPRWLSADDGAVVIAIYVKPRASKTRVVGEHADALAVQVAAPPVEGAANDALVAYLAKALSVPRSAVTLVGGETSKNKRIRVSGVSAEHVERALAGPA